MTSGRFAELKTVRIFARLKNVQASGSSGEIKVYGSLLLI